MYNEYDFYSYPEDTKDRPEFRKYIDPHNPDYEKYHPVSVQSEGGSDEASGEADEEWTSWNEESFTVRSYF